MATRPSPKKKTCTCNCIVIRNYRLKNKPAYNGCAADGSSLLQFAFNEDAPPNPRSSCASAGTHEGTCRMPSTPVRRLP